MAGVITTPAIPHLFTFSLSTRIGYGLIGDAVKAHLRDVADYPGVTAGYGYGSDAAVFFHRL